MKYVRNSPPASVKRLSTGSPLSREDLYSVTSTNLFVKKALISGTQVLTAVIKIVKEKYIGLLLINSPISLPYIARYSTKTPGILKKPFLSSFWSTFYLLSIRSIAPDKVICI